MDFLKELSHAGHIYSKDPSKYAEQKKKEKEYNHEYYTKHKHPNSVSDMLLQSEETVKEAAKSPALYNRMKESVLDDIKKSSPSDYEKIKNNDTKLSTYIGMKYGKNPAYMQLAAEVSKRGMAIKFIDSVAEASIDYATNKYNRK
jgi:hypothetical protein